MKIKREVLVETLEAEVRRLENDHAARVRRDADDALARRAAYVRRTGDAWGAFAKVAARRARNGEPVTIDDVPEALLDGARSSYVAVWRERQPKHGPADEELPRVRQLRLLVQLLKASEDEYVSTYDLEKQGVSLKSLVGR